MKEMKVLSTYFITGKLLCASSLLYIFIYLFFKGSLQIQHIQYLNMVRMLLLFFVGSGAAESALV
jgi:hypothetical protein